MKKTLSLRLLSVFLALSLTLTVFAPVYAFAGDDVADDNAAFGSGNLESITLSAWVNRAVPEETMRQLLNSQTLYPQRTGWKELDNLMESMIAGAGADADTYTKLRYMYDWLVKNVTYSWEGYSYTSASVKAYNSVTGYNYLKDMTYEEGLEKSIPDDMANRTYHILTAKKGVCYDYAIAIAVIARYIGIESYVHTGVFIFEDSSNGSGHHGWSLLVLGGEKYVFDPQRDARNWQYYGRNGYYFGIDYDTAISTNYYPDCYASDTTANAERDASMLPVDGDRAHQVSIDVTVSGKGTVSGAGKYITGEKAVLKAVPKSNWCFTGWYDSKGKLLSKNATYTFSVTEDAKITAKFAELAVITVKASRSGSVSGDGTYIVGDTVTLTSQGVIAGWYDAWVNLLGQEDTYTFSAQCNATIIAMFEGDVFYDLQEDDWYTPYAMEAWERGLVNGVSAIEFGGNKTFTRAMLVKILANLEQADTASAAPSPFEDVAETAWYYESVNWAYENGIVEGVDSTRFAPNDPVTREQILAMVVRYLEWKGIELEAEELTYTDADQFSDYAVIYAQKAQAIGLIEGYEDGSFRPQNQLPRREGVTILVRLARYLDSCTTEEETPDVSPDETPEPAPGEESPDETPEPAPGEESPAA